MPLYRHKHTGALVLATTFLGVISDEIRQLLGEENKDWRHQPELGSIDLGVGTREAGDAQTEAETLRQHDILVRDPQAGTAVALSPQEFAENYDSAAQHPDEPLTQAEYLKDRPLPAPDGGTVTVTPSDDDAVRAFDGVSDDEVRHLLDDNEDRIATLPDHALHPNSRDEAVRLLVRAGVTPPSKPSEPADATNPSHAAAQPGESAAAAGAANTAPGGTDAASGTSQV